LFLHLRRLSFHQIFFCELILHFTFFTRLTTKHTHTLCDTRNTPYSPTRSILTAAGRMTGPEISASRWLNCARAILHCWWPICTASDVETPPLVHNGTDEMAEHLVLHCPAHDQAWWESWPNLLYQSDPRWLWSFLERIGAVTRPPPS